MGLRLRGVLENMLAFRYPYVPPQKVVPPLDQKFCVSLATQPSLPSLLHGTTRRLLHLPTTQCRSHRLRYRHLQLLHQCHLLIQTLLRGRNLLQFHGRQLRQTTCDGALQVALQQ